MATIIANFIIIILITISIVSIKKYKLLGVVVAVALIGSDTDSAGLLYSIENYIPIYKILVRGTVIVLFLYSIIHIIKSYSQKKIRWTFMKWYFFPLLGVSIIIFLTNLLRGEGIVISLSEVIWLGIPFFFIWTSGILKYDSELVLNKLIIYQAIITIIVLTLGPLVGTLNGANYAHIIGNDYWASISDQIINTSISFGNFNKHSLSVFKFAQFHNPNALGLYSTVFISTSIFIWRTRKSKSTAIFLLLVGIIGWFNSLTRGPILIAGLVVFVYLLGIFIRPKTYGRVFLILFIGILGVLNINLLMKSFDYLFVDSSNVSIVARLDGYVYAFEAISKNPLFGIKPGINDPIPHMLPLKIAAYYGIPAAILITVPFIHLITTTIRNFTTDLFAGKAERSLYPSMLAGIIIGAYLTNGVIVYVLFWVLLSYILQKNSVLKRYQDKEYKYE